MNIIIIGKLWPEPNSSAAGKRMMQLIAFFQSIGSVHFASCAQKTGNEILLDSFVTSSEFIQLNNDSFNQYITKIQPSVVVFDRFMTEEQFSWRVREICPNAIRIIDTEDLHFLRNQRKAVIKKDQSMDWYSEDAMRELAAISRSDLSLIISTVEMSLLKEKYKVPEHLLFYLPLFSNGIQLPQPSYEERKDVFFIGNFLHEPNVDAVRFLKNDLWPLIRLKHPTINLHVYGAYLTQELTEFNNLSEGFIVHGRCEDVYSTTKKFRISLAPLRFGAGVKGKLIEAMECGTPSLTSPIGIEGIALANDWPGVVFESPEEFVRGFEQLYFDPNFWLEKQQLGINLLEELSNKEEILESFSIQLEKLSQSLDEHRSQNYISHLLWHQSLQGSKYMSKWIMEKRKNTE